MNIESAVIARGRVVAVSGKSEVGSCPWFGGLLLAVRGYSWRWFQVSEVVDVELKNVF